LQTLSARSSMTVADSFRQAALDNEDFGSVGRDVVLALLKGYGKLADGVFFLRLGFAQLNVNLLRVAKTIVEKVNPVFKTLAEAYNVMASAFGMDLIDQGKLDKIGMNLEGAIGSAIGRVSEMMAQPLPSAGIDATFAAIEERSRRMAEEIANNAPGKVLLQDAEPSGAKIQEKMTFFQEQAVAGEKKRKEFMLMSATAQTSHVLGELGNQFAGIASNNKKLFAMNKAFQIAQAIMQTYQGATLAMSSYPPPLNFVMAAATVASGLSQVAQIKAQSFEGGGFHWQGFKIWRPRWQGRISRCLASQRDRDRSHQRSRHGRHNHHQQHRRKGRRCLGRYEDPRSHAANQPADRHDNSRSDASEAVRMTTYTFPAITPSANTFELITNTRTFQSPLTNAVQTVQRKGSLWKASLQFNNLTGDNRAEMQAFLAKLNGQQHRFYLPDHGFVRRGSAPSLAQQLVTAGNFTIGATYVITTIGTTDFSAIGASANTIGVIFTATGAGSGTGTATQNNLLIDGANQTGAILDVRNAILSRSNYFKAGDYIAFGNELHMVTAACDSNSSGTSSADSATDPKVASELKPG
jgi:hypothetical protein